MWASPNRRVWMTSGQKVANHLTRAVPGTHGRDAGLVAPGGPELGWLRGKSGAGLVAREGWRWAGCAGRLALGWLRGDGWRWASWAGREGTACAGGPAGRADAGVSPRSP